MNPSRPSTPKISIPKTADGCSPTITSSFGIGISIANLLGVNHFPKGGGIDNQKVRMRKLLINPNSGGAISHHPNQLLQGWVCQLYPRRWQSRQRSLNHPKVMSYDKIIKLADLNIPGRFEQQNRVYSTHGISPTLNSAMGHGGNCVPMLLIINRL